MADERAFEDFIVDELGPRIDAAWDEVGRELIEGSGTGEPRGVLPGRCVYPPHQLVGVCDGSCQRHRWIPARDAVAEVETRLEPRARPYRYRGYRGGSA